MGKFRRLFDGFGMLGVPAALNEKETKITPRTLSYVMSSVIELYHKINGGISFGSGEPGFNAGNLDAQVIRYSFTSGVEAVIPHRLGRIPVGYLVFRRTGNCHLVDSQVGLWNDEFFRVTATSTQTLTFLLF